MPTRQALSRDWRRPQPGQGGDLADTLPWHHRHVRSNDPVSATTDFYIVIGQAPRYLDNIMTLFGRVVYGMDAVQRIKRATLDEGGMIADKARQSRIDWVKVAADLPADKRLPIEIERTDTLPSRRSSRPASIATRLFLQQTAAGAGRLPGAGGYPLKTITAPPNRAT